MVRANKLESCYLRPLTWIGSQKLGVSPKGNQIHLMVAAWAWGAYLGEEGMKRGIRVKTSSYTRHHVNITMTQAKAVSNYSNSILANMEALDDGYDEALLLDSSGFVSEGAGENIFVVKDGVVYTPDLSAGALNGITRNTVLHICKDLGIELVQKRITRDEVYIADEAFFTGTAAEVTPIRELDRVEIGAGSRGPITEKIQSAFFDIVNGRNPEVRPLAHQGLSMTTHLREQRSRRRTAGQGPERQRRRVLPQPQGRHEAVEQPPARLPGRGAHRRGQVPLLRHGVQAQRGRALRRGPLKLVIAGLDPASTVRAPAWMPDQVRHDSP